MVVPRWSSKTRLAFGDFVVPEDCDSQQRENVAGWSSYLPDKLIFNTEMAVLFGHM